VVSFVLSAVSGYVDTAGFILLSGIFTSHVTGNLVLAGAAIAGQSGEGVRVRLALLLVFMLAVGAASALARWAEKRSHATVAVLLSAEAMMLGIFLLAGLLLEKCGQRFSELELFLIASSAVIAMGIQNALMRDGLKSFLPTTMMTGNTTQFTLDSLALLRGTNAEEILSRFRRTSIVLAGFVLGAAFGALAAALMRMWSPIFPMIAITLLALLAVHGSSKPSKAHA
jgi:uncharacterized membrane protein YoaK (UPF0700 family)